MCEMQGKGSLGCFGLTEKLAGVQSGLVVGTTAEWDDEKQHFLLNTPNKGAQKNWISQGYTADKAVVMADLIIGGKSVGPHAFLMDFRNDGAVIDGVDLGDMGR
jgi:acyl-CoA oxidase